jgi:putative N6-adenine-specific DNA methylase
VARANVFSRIAQKILWQLKTFEADSTEALQEQLITFPFEKILDVKTTFACTSHLYQAPLNHSHYAALLVKDCIADRFANLDKSRPDVDSKTPACRFILSWFGKEAILSLDTTGKPLFKRGYRAPGAKAPLHENLGAALLSIAHADVRRPFWDPCCGTGTLGIEQAMRCLDIAPSKSRRFAFERWAKAPRVLARLLKEAREEALDKERKELKAPIIISDWNDNAVMLARESVQNAGLEQFIEVKTLDARDINFAEENFQIVSNLPYGERLGDVKAKGKLQLDGLYRQLGQKWSDLPTPMRVIILSGLAGAGKTMNMGNNKRWEMQNGGLNVRLYRWDLA